MKKGITLIEILVIIAIIAILAAIIFPAFKPSKHHGSYHMVTDQYIGGQHIQVMEDDVTHKRFTIVNDKIQGN